MCWALADPQLLETDAKCCVVTGFLARFLVRASHLIDSAELMMPSTTVQHAPSPKESSPPYYHHLHTPIASLPPPRPLHPESASGVFSVHLRTPCEVCSRPGWSPAIREAQHAKMWCSAGRSQDPHKISVAEARSSSRCAASRKRPAHASEPGGARRASATKDTRE
jgi:hypothetical protein